MEAIIASILGGLVSGLFAFLGVWLTIRHENKKARQEWKDYTSVETATKCFENPILW